MDIPTARKLLQVSPYATPQEIKKKYYNNIRCVIEVNIIGELICGIIFIL